MKNKNIFLIYFISCLRNSWFWMGIWVFYYLRFTDYSGIGLIETVLILTTIFSEIPTGAIADLIGKKITLLISLFLSAIGQLIMALTGNLSGLLISVFIMGIGAAFYSGTLDAFVYDSLKEKNQQSNYDKIFSKIQSFQLITIMFCTIVGGYLYSVSPRLPFFLNSGCLFIGAILSLFLTEPLIDSVKFSFKNFIFQTKQGFNHLFKSKTVKKQVYLLLSIGCIFTISTEVLDSVLGVEFGFNARSLSLLTALILLITSIVVRLSPLLRRKYGDISSVFFIGLLGVGIYLISPFVTLLLGGLVLILRQSVDSIFQNLSSTTLNKLIPSTYRTTSLSTFNMVKNLPYAIGAFFIGNLMDTITARNFAFILGVLLLAFLIPNYLNLRKNTN